MYKTFTAARIARLILNTSLSHAERCLDEAESQLGKAKCADARAKWNAVAKEWAEQ